MQVECYEWGMQPRDFWECTLSDIAYFVVGNKNRIVADQEAKNVEMYALAKMSAIMNAVNLQNALSSKRGHTREYPKYEDFFKKKAFEENNNSKYIHDDVYEHIDDNNKYEFLHKQKLAYEKMGYKFD